MICGSSRGTRCWSATVPATPTALPRRELRSRYCFCSSISAYVVPSPTVAFTINPILSTDPTVALRLPTIGPIKQSKTSSACWPQLDRATSNSPPHLHLLLPLTPITHSQLDLRSLQCWSRFVKDPKFKNLTIVLAYLGMDLAILGGDCPMGGVFGQSLPGRRRSPWSSLHNLRPSPGSRGSRFSSP